MLTLPIEELRRRAGRIKLVLSDNDGVLTDNGVYYSERGEEMKRYSIRDGMGVERLRAEGIETGIMTGELSPSIKKRADKLAISNLYLGIKDKVSMLDTVQAETGFALCEIAYIGDDVNDIGIMNVIAPEGLTACPQDGTPFVEHCVHYRAKVDGGHGAFRDFAEWLIDLRVS
ncbi:3-deoxy-D-manno-octulosonate 8-phosphate phosphatase [Chlorobium sp. BLA1]|uniref:KdsC family phosphatase n=1 Tax=Candidatus Chlorobium masyuteum TaxID=2716876 RepID=UPI0014214277|nr:3-deoxy-D-manno-octulosonate 8-phosphate phosphatase [Candidatus Chlorobium masyuteum]NHQ61024.1 3-deoxy-D-manno-octulosonate 8-phosphate phosphatase [Candidatus Chlorobium masyuteum]NTU45570.1 3-deoxy-D-manno-octulosonate 8-phosphate phosphatase [Chlorobiaceae bacterium]